MITITSKGGWDKTEKYLRRLKAKQYLAVLEKYGPIGVNALSNATPVDTMETANSWYYKITARAGYFSIVWHNRNVVDGIPVAVMIQYGHGTGTGGYVSGRDYINPVIRPLFDQIVNDFVREVRSIG